MLAGAFTLGGCDAITGPARYIPEVVEVTVADSVAAGQLLDVKIHWLSTDGCQRFDGFAARTLDDSTFQLTPLAHRASGVVCTQVITNVEEAVRFGRLPARRFTVRVIARQDTFDLPVQGGAAPAAIERHRVQVEDAATGKPRAGATVAIVGVFPTDTLAKLTTAADGSAEVVLPCLAAGRAYDLVVVGGPRVRFARFPARCGVPERTVLRY
jgi:hypothetical protein